MTYLRFCGGVMPAIIDREVSHEARSWSQWRCNPMVVGLSDRLVEVKQFCSIFRMSRVKKDKKQL